VNRSARVSRDPFLVSVAVLVAMAIIGFVFVWLAWRTSTFEAIVASQLPYLASAGIGGMAIIGFSAAIFMIQLRRRTEARRRASNERVLDAAAAIVAALRADPNLRP